MLASNEKSPLHTNCHEKQLQPSYQQSNHETENTESWMAVVENSTVTLRNQTSASMRAAFHQKKETNAAVTLTRRSSSPVCTSIPERGR
jgi:fatty acid/phospholipid biosynthesis enzyme